MGCSELSIATGEFSQAIADLSTSDVGKQLSGALAALAEVERKAQDLQNVQAQEDVVTIMSTGKKSFCSLSLWGDDENSELILCSVFQLTSIRD